MSPAAAAKRSRPLRAPALAARGGLIAVGGPPYCGKSPLAARLAELLPRAVKIESSDNVARTREVYFPDGVAAGAAGKSLESMLETAEAIWSARRVATPPTIILCARLATPAARAKLFRFAKLRDMRFLLVEARSRTNRSLVRLCRLSSTPGDVDRHVRNLERARKSFKPLTRAETKLFRCARVSGVLQDLDAASDTVLQLWTQ